MEISLRERVYAINPRRIIYVECYKQDRFGRCSQTNPYPETEEDNELKMIYDYCIEIHMTDDVNIKYNIDNISCYEELRNELKKIVGGWFWKIIYSG